MPFVVSSNGVSKGLDWIGRGIEKLEFGDFFGFKGSGGVGLKQGRRSEMVELVHMPDPEL